MRRVIIAAGLLLPLILVGWYIYEFPKPATLPTGNSQTAEADESEYVGAISVGSSRAFFRYVSSKYAVSFEFPSDWYVGDNRLGYGAFQISNYDLSLADGKGGFSNGMNKIEGAVHNRMYSEPSDIYVETSRVTEKLIIAERDAVKENVTLEGGSKMRSYSIPLSEEGKYLWLTIYGDSSNFYVLDDLVRTVKFQY